MFSLYALIIGIPALLLTARGIDELAEHMQARKSTSQTMQRPTSASCIAIHSYYNRKGA